MDIVRSVVMVVSCCLIFDYHAPRLLVAQTPPLTAQRQPSAEPPRPWNRGSGKANQCAARCPQSVQYERPRHRLLLSLHACQESRQRGMNDIHFHPVEPRTVRLCLTYKF